jgi:LuxR family maltose regulon positive regulatory protein
MAVAAWLQASGTTAVWYQLDEGDADVASFYHFLTLALQRCKRTRQKSLPRLTPELYAALSIFTRNYSRAFFESLKAPAVLVLDNWQDVPAGASLRELLPVLVGEVPMGITVMVLSREDPPANLSRLSSSGQMALLRWAELQLTVQETGELAAHYRSLHRQGAVSSPTQLHAATQGWAAGVKLLLRNERAVGSSLRDAYDRANPFNG